MSGLSLTLSNALTGLNVNQKALAVLSQNISNANTAGYSRQVLNQESLYLDGNGLGVTIKDVTRKVDEYLIGAAREQTSAVGLNTILTDYQDRIQLMLGTPGANNNMSAFVGSFFNNIQSLAQAPEDTTKQQTAVAAGTTLASQISDLARNLQQLQFEADQQIGNAVQVINADLKQISELNFAISNAQTLGKPSGDLQDRRDMLLNNLAEYMDIRVYKRENGAVNITTGSGASLLDDSIYQLSYSPSSSAASFSKTGTHSPLTVTRVGADGQAASTPITLITGGTSDKVVSALVGGQIRGLIDIRDQQIPALVDQLDMMASTLRDTINAIHNEGTAYPGANQLTGTRLLSASDSNHWSGSVTIAVLDAVGQPAAKPYDGQEGGLVPLTIDLSKLDTGAGAGNPSIQGIIDEINQYYGTPQNKLQLGNLDNIELTSNTKTLPGTPPIFNFDFDLSNLSDTSSSFYITGLSMTDDQNNALPTPTSTIPSVALATLNTFVTSVNSNDMTVNTAGTHNLVAGQKVYIPSPTTPATIGGINSSNIGGYYTIKNVTGTSFQVELSASAATSESPDIVGLTALPPYSEIAAGENARTTGKGTFTADLSGSTLSQFYTVTVNMAVDDGEGNISQTQATFRVNSQNYNQLNTRTPVSTANGDATIKEPTTRTPTALAMLVGADGKELAKINGIYTTSEQGYMVIKASNGNNTIAIDSKNSQQLGTTGVNGTNRSFSHYLELNNFFQSTAPSETGDAIAGSAIKLKVETRLQTNPSLIALGSLVQSASKPGLNPSYTLERLKGDNTIAQKLAGLATNATVFGSAGGLPISSVSFSTYAASIISTASQKNSAVNTALSNAQTLLTGFTERASSISGVNLDTELANTIIYQNAYSASARIITVTNDLFETLMQLAR